ncbi:unnamed protein product [Calypogeia fissa]
MMAGSAAFSDDYTKPLLQQQELDGQQCRKDDDEDDEKRISALENGTGEIMSSPSSAGASVHHPSRVCMSPISKVDILEGFETGSSGALQTDAQTVLNTMNLYVGVGLLSLGFAVKLGGWMSLALLAIIGVIFAYSAKLICRSFLKVPRSVVPSYPNLGATVYGTPGQLAVMLMGGTEFFGALCLCLIIVWQSITMLLPASPLCVGRICFTPGQVAILGSTLVMLPAVLVRTFSRLTSISISGVISSLLLTSVVVIAYAVDPERKQVTPDSKVHETVDWTHLPMAAGIMVISLSGHAGLPSLRRSMINPEHFERCINIAFSCMFLVYATMGGFAYLYFGQATQVLITGNLNEASSITGFIILRIGSFSLSVNHAITVLVAMSAYTTIPALVYVIAELVVDIVRGEPTRTPGVGDLIARVIVLVLGYLVAITAYNVLDSVESIVGGVCSVSVSLLLPSLFHFKIYKKELSRSRKVVVVGMVIFGVICVVGIATMNILKLFDKLD